MSKVELNRDSVVNRETKIADIGDMLQDMSDEQIDNVHVYTVDEYQEPNHETIALQAVIDLSRKYKKAGCD